MNISYLMLIYGNRHHNIGFDTNSLSKILVVIHIFLLAEKIPIYFAWPCTFVYTLNTTGVYVGFSQSGTGTIHSSCKALEWNVIVLVNGYVIASFLCVVLLCTHAYHRQASSFNELALDDVTILMSANFQWEMND